MREATNLDTLQERLRNKEYLNYTFQDTVGAWHMLTALPKRVMANGEIETVIFVVQNIDEQKRRELEYQNQILETAEEARRANAAKTEFLRRMSHDIRTPINGVMGMLNIGDHFPEDMEKQKECREKIRDAAMFLFELVNDVLDMSKMEYGEIEFKNSLTAQGKIKYGGGKCELIRIGAFDDIDLDIVHHTGDKDISVGSHSNNGFVSKVIRYKGLAAHAAGAPYLGVNALNAASLGLSALAYQRETFRDDDHVRIHPIITKGGNLVNVVPDEVVIETLVRAANKDAIADAAAKTDRAFKAGAIAVGASCEITTMPGYLPALSEKADASVLAAAEIAAQTSENDYQIVQEDTHAYSGGSTDVGDVQHLQPVLTFNTGGKVNGLHSVDFDIVDEELAYVVTAKIFALSAYRLLRDGAVKAKEIVANYQPIFTKEEYIKYMDSFIKTETYQ